MIDRVSIPPRLKAQLGADHIDWILAGPNPIGYCEGRARGAWDANDAELQGAYAALVNVLTHGGTEAGVAPSWAAQWERYFLGLSDLRGRAWGESDFEYKRKTGQSNTHDKLVATVTGLRRVALDRGGYSRESGQYYGVGAPVYEYEYQDPHSSRPLFGAVRAYDLTEARRNVKKEHDPGDRYTFRFER